MKNDPKIDLAKKAFGAVFKAKMAEHGYSQEYIADKLSISQAQINRLANGKSPGSVKSLTAISGLFGRTYEEMMKEGYSLIGEGPPIPKLTTEEIKIKELAPLIKQLDPTGISYIKSMIQNYLNEQKKREVIMLDEQAELFELIRQMAEKAGVPFERYQKHPEFKDAIKKAMQKIKENKEKNQSINTI